MTEPVSLFAAFSAIGEWLDRLIQTRAARTEAGRQAAEKLLHALAETQAHIEDLENGSPSLRARQRELAKLWGDAAAAFYGVDPNIAPLLRLKSESWAAPSKWPEERVRALGIEIEQVSAKADVFLKAARA